MKGKSKFGELFKQYRLKAGIPTLSAFGHLLAEKGFNYEDSIFSHWQKGSRIPQYRVLLFKIIEIFIEKGVISEVHDVNELLESANQNNLSEQEINSLQLNSQNRVFQVPSEISNFTGREKIANEIVQSNLTGQVVLISGPAGVGKTVLAIHLGHLLKDKYEDGVLWYKIEEDNIADILLSIAKTFGEDISGISNLQVKVTVVRSLLSGKNTLLFLDSAELSDEINLLIPNSRFCTTIITSQKSQLKNPVVFKDVKLKAFTKEESLNLFKNVLKDNYLRIGKGNLLKIAEKVGNLPLAIHLLAGELMQKNIDSKELLQGEPYKESTALDSAIALSYDKLSSRDKSVLLSTTIFKGKDFSLESISYINGLSRHHTVGVLYNLINLSLVENSTKNRFRIHPVIRSFVREELNNPKSIYLSLFAVLIFFSFTLWWIFVQSYGVTGDIFGATYFIMALYGGVVGLHTSFRWGGLKNLLGKAIFMFSSGLLLQVFGQLAYAYYIDILHVPVPYPSVGDIGFLGAIPFYIWGSFLLAESSGIKINLRLFVNNKIALVVPVALVLIAYTLFLRNYVLIVSQPVKTFLDFAYPLGEAIYISIAIIIFIFSRTILDGIMQSKAFLLLIALLFQFITDYAFVYDAKNYYSGNYIDFMCLVSYFIMTLALLSFKSIQIKVYKSL